MIKLTNVSYSYPQQRRPALNHLSLSVSEGEAVCIMGANGCGKSTLALLLAGLIKPQGGRMELEVTDDTQLPVGILFQNPDNQMVAVTVEKEIAFALENLGIPPDEMDVRIGETLEHFRITHLRKRLTSELSGGEKQRVALASVMVSRPPILILDEPDSFLDQAGKQFLAEELHRLRQSTPGLIELRITQYRQIAENYGRLIVMQDGGIVADAPPERIFHDHALCLKTALRFDPETVTRPVATGFDLSPDDRLVQIAVKDVSFGYPEEPEIFERLSCSLSAGQSVGVVGPSGSGKSSLVKLMCNLMKPTAGRIMYLDADSAEQSFEQVRGRVTALFQQPERQFFLPTAAEEIGFGPSNFGHKLAETELTALFRLAGLEAGLFKDRDPISLSGGEKRRLAFASVLSMRPRFVLFDEPTCGLDQEGVGRFIRLCNHLRRQQVGIMVITHDGEIIKAVTDQVLAFSGNGSIRYRSREKFFDTPELAGIVSKPS